VRVKYPFLRIIAGFFQGGSDTSIIIFSGAMCLYFLTTQTIEGTQLQFDNTIIKLPETNILFIRIDRHIGFIYEPLQVTSATYKIPSFTSCPYVLTPAKIEVKLNYRYRKTMWFFGL